VGSDIREPHCRRAIRVTASPSLESTTAKTW
jgi:hypothetical protein